MIFNMAASLWTTVNSFEFWYWFNLSSKCRLGVSHWDTTDRLSFVPVMVKARTSLQVWALAYFAKGSKAANVTGKVPLIAGYIIASGCLSCARTCSFLQTFIMSTGTINRNDKVHVDWFHSFIRTHQRGRGDELSTGVHYEGTWWSGQPKEQAMIKEPLSLKSNAGNTKAYNLV